MKSFRSIEPELIDHQPEKSSNNPDLAGLKTLAKLMDNAFQIPGFRFRFGLDSILGLVPGLGDFATSLVTFYILQEAHRRGVSKPTMARMGFNILVDWLIGSIPLAGDVFDVWWKSNHRNVQLLLEHEAVSANAPLRSARRDWIFLSALIGLLLLALVGSLTISWFIVSWITGWVWPGRAG